MLFSHFTECPARALERLETTRDLVLWMILSVGGIAVFLHGSAM
ncbi:MAG: hypothetical protein R3B09_04350 [Nannocystaceae bacterium]